MNPPGFIRLLLWYHCTTVPPNDPPNDSIRRDWTDQMLNEGLIMSGEEPGTFTTSAKGIAYVELLTNTPFPVRVWIDPRSKIFDHE